MIVFDDELRLSKWRRKESRQIECGAEPHELHVKNRRSKFMSKQKESNKLNRLEINKETVRDLDPNNAGDVRGGATANLNITEQIRCDLANKTIGGEKCDRQPAFSLAC
jgi:hypothetical protein